MSDDLSIDPHKLEEEWMRQPLLYEKYAELSRAADETHQIAKDQLESVKAGLDSQIRKDFESFGMKKLTEGALNNTILLQKEYIAANSVVVRDVDEFTIVGGSPTKFIKERVINE